MLLFVMIDHLQDQFSHNGAPDHLTFFYASTQEDNFRRNADEVIRSVVRQLSIAGTALEPAIRQKYDDLTAATNEPSRSLMPECVEMILALTDSFSIVIIIDGLNALQTGNAIQKIQSSRNDLIRSLNDILKQFSNPVKLLFFVLPHESTADSLRKIFANIAADDLKSPNN